MKNILLISFILLFWSDVFAQNNDAQLWENIYIEKNLSRKVYIHINHEGRITENVSKLSYGYLDGGISYKMTKMDHVSVDYVFEIKKFYDGKTSFRHQYYFSNTIKEKLKPFVFYWRVMYQLEFDDVRSTETGKLPSQYIRNKITMKIKNKSRYIPYLASELNYNANQNQKYTMQFDRLRMFAGVFYELNKIDQLEAYYLCEKHFQIKDPDTNWIFGIGFNHLFY